MLQNDIEVHTIKSKKHIQNENSIYFFLKKDNVTLLSHVRQLLLCWFPFSFILILLHSSSYCSSLADPPPHLLDPPLPLPLPLSSHFSSFVNPLLLYLLLQLLAGFFCPLLFLLLIAWSFLTSFMNPSSFQLPFHLSLLILQMLLHILFSVVAS